MRGHHRSRSHCSQAKLATPAMILAVCLLTPCFSSAQTSPASPGYRIAGIAVSKLDGHPLSRVRVTATDTANSQKSASVITGDDGRFEFTTVPAGKYSLNGAKRGFIASYYDQHENFWTGIVTGGGVDTENLVLKLAPSAAITGQVLDESGDPVRNARITLYRVDHSSGIEQIRGFRSAQTDDLGNYEFASLNAGTYFLSASAQPWYALHPQTNAADNTSNFDRTLDVTYPLTYYADTTDTDSATPIPVRGGERVQVDLHLIPIPGLRVVFHTASGRDGGSFPRLEQPSFDGSTPVEVGSVRMLSHGEVEISGVPAGRYDIRLRGPGGGAEIRGVDLTRNGQEIETTSAENMADIKLTARMSDGTRLPKQVVVALTSNSKSSPLTSVPLDEKGNAEMSHVTAGSYQLMAWGSGRQFSLSELSADGAQVTGHTVTLSPGASVSLSLTLSTGSAELEGVVKHAGKPFAGAMVVLVPRHAEGNRDLFRRDQSDLDGTFALRDVVPGSYTLIAIDNGWDLDWSQPDIIAAYAKHGQVIEIRNGSNLKVHIPQPVDVVRR
jgi:Carboxypeptidase regulatory-like domain/Prealbumin-like fold domain